MIRSTLSALAALAMIGGTALAGDGNSRLSVGYTHLDGDGGTLGAVTGRYNRALTQYFGVEGEIHYGVLDDEIDFLGEEIEVSANFGYGIFGTLAAPVGANGSNVFVRAGYQSVEIEAELEGESVADDLDGFAYGVGTNLMFSEKHGVRLDYTRIEGEDDASADTYGVAFVAKF